MTGNANVCERLSKLPQHHCDSNMAFSVERGASIRARYWNLGLRWV